VGEGVFVFFCFLLAKFWCVVMWVFLSMITEKKKEGKSLNVGDDDDGKEDFKRKMFLNQLEICVWMGILNHGLTMDFFKIYNT
jgi:hypothetical protein